MKIHKLFLVLPFLLALVVAIGCDSDDDIKAQDEQEPSPELDGATCPCFTPRDLRAGPQPPMNDLLSCVDKDTDLEDSTTLESSEGLVGFAGSGQINGGSFEFCQNQKGIVISNISDSELEECRNILRSYAVDNLGLVCEIKNN